MRWFHTGYNQMQVKAAADTYVVNGQPQKLVEVQRRQQGAIVEAVKLAAVSVFAFLLGRSKA